jgi:1-hydroxycarotenoid 3,4-desaturase
VVVGAGAGGLACAIALAAAHVPVVVVEAAATPGGKIRQVAPGGRPIDTGPTVFTMREVFEELFGLAGLRVDEALDLEPLDILARHAWQDEALFDLPADADAAQDGIGRFFSRADAQGFTRFGADARRVHDALLDTFMRASKPGPLELAARFGPARLADLVAAQPFRSLWDRLGDYFPDGRLRQLFARYATYAGGSPFLAPSTLMLIAHVEMQGVWQVTGGMGALARALEAAGRRLGVRYLYQAPVRRVLHQGDRAAGVELADGTRIAARAVVLNADAGAVSAGLVGDQAAWAAAAPVKRKARSLSALTWAVEAQVSGLDLHHHTVLFGADYRGEFDAILRQRRLPDDPTIYICAQDRSGQTGAVGADAAQRGTERLLLLVNAPPDGDRGAPTLSEMDRCTDMMLAVLARRGLRVRLDSCIRSGPPQLERLFPGTGGAIYGPAPHGAFSPFRRAGARTRMKGLWLAGGSVHPSAGVPMAALSGLTCARQLLADLASTRRFHPVAMPGGISTPSAPTAASA